MHNKIFRNFRIRKSYAGIPKIIDIPDLITLQKQSYNRFLQKDVPEGRRENIGLQSIFKSVFPIYDYNKVASLEFVKYVIDEPKYDVYECKERGMSYASPMKVVFQLVLWDVNKETGERNIRDVKEQEVYFGEIPCMTESGTFIINGIERVIVTQLHRSPGVFFEHDKGKTHATGKLLYSARIIPYRGSWIDFEFDHKDILYVRIDRRRKIPATVLLKALGWTKPDIIDLFYKKETIQIIKDKTFKLKLDFDILNYYVERSIVAPYDLFYPKKDEPVIQKKKRIQKQLINELEEKKITYLIINEEDILGKILAEDVVDEETGEILVECSEEITRQKIAFFKQKGINEFKILHTENIGPFLRDTLMVDKTVSEDEAVREIYMKLRPGEPYIFPHAKKYIETLFFSPARYDLSSVGRLKMNYKFGLNTPLEETTLKGEDIIEVMRYLLRLKSGDPDCSVDDIDHLGNRRVRAVGELVENQYRIGLVRMERSIREKMSMSHDLETLMPHDLINAKPVSAVLREYFASSQLSQFMDQTNPLAEITHKRRLSALGPGGLTRDRAGFEVRDVHPSHYGRICPIETPEGQNIGLITSLSSYARIDPYGFIETPYRKVENGRVTNEVVYLSALKEEKYIIAQADSKIDNEGKFVEKFINVREKGEFSIVPAEDVQYIDISPTQLVSVAASLIPFLEHNDANRALMGSNMQRQSVPLIKNSAPLVGTGMEGVVAKDSGVIVVAKNDGIVESVDAQRIVIRRIEDEGEKADIYNLVKFQRSNQNTCINQRPLVSKGDFVKKNNIIADGFCTDHGELALGKNILVAFMPWEGYNFEDSILISERLVQDDVYTSIHIEEFECVARDTKLGKEEITRDIPNVREEALANLDSSGIVRIGAYVKPGDILVGKITPKGETQLSPEEKLLRAIFGEKAGDVRDTSKRVDPGIFGIVIGAKIFLRKGVEKDERTMDIEAMEEQRLHKDRSDEIKIIEESTLEKIYELLDKKIADCKVSDAEGNILLKKNKVITKDILQKLTKHQLKELRIKDGEEIEGKVYQLFEKMEDRIYAVKTLFNEKIKKLKRGDELPPGVIKMVKVYVAIKRKLQVGDKMAGRHGNKGVISTILPIEDMPYLPDGTPVDIVLNPLGVPSRMNVGQILETHLGWAAHEIGAQLQEILKSYSTEKIKERLKKIWTTQSIHKIIDEMDEEELKNFVSHFKNGIFVETPVFDGAKEQDIKALLLSASLPEDGKTILYDGRSGEPFDSKVTVGYIYMMKLHHLVDEKIHARSTGPYSLVTQQPLGGKAQFGGQRLGEMEVWAMQAYGAAYGLQEFLTYKADDVAGRTAAYEAIVKGEHKIIPGLPESFHVLVKELKSLAIDVELLENIEEAKS